MDFLDKLEKHLSRDHQDEEVVDGYMLGIQIADILQDFDTRFVMATTGLKPDDECRSTYVTGFVWGYLGNALDEFYDFRSPSETPLPTP